jgi:RecA/RadA recombinase
MAAAYLKQYDDAVLLFYDSEFGSPQDYFTSFGIDTNRVLHTPITNVEELKFDCVHQLEQLEKKDKVIIVMDSIGNLASKKEVEDAENAKSVADMSRAKALKSLFRIITPKLKMLDIPCLVINHVYAEQGLFPRQIVSGGTGVMYSADWVWIVGRQQDKVGTEIKGYNFVINIEKSRFVKEKSKIPISVSWDGGIDKYSGLFDLAQELGYIKGSGAWYQTWDFSTNDFSEKKVQRKLIGHDFFDELLKDDSFKNKIKKQFKISSSEMLSETVKVAYEEGVLEDE